MCCVSGSPMSFLAAVEVLYSTLPTPLDQVVTFFQKRSRVAVLDEPCNICAREESCQDILRRSCC